MSKSICLDCIGCEVDSELIIKTHCNSFIPTKTDCTKEIDCQECMECTYEAKLD